MNERAYEKPMVDGATDARVEMRLLGSFELRVDGRRIDAVGTPRLESLLAYLALHRAAPVSRNEIAFSLWPESGDAQALTNLRRELHALRRALPDASRLLEVEHRRIAWRFGPATVVDVAGFEAAVERWRGGDPEAAAEAVRLYGGDLLRSCYDDWIEPDRERLRASFLEALEARIGHLEAGRDYDAARRHLRRLIQVDPLQERAYLALMRIAAASGDRAAGLHAYHACAAMVRRELDVEPGAEIQAAYRRLLSAEPPGSAGLATVPTPSPMPPIGPPPVPLIGRAAEWATFLHAWGQVRGTGPHLLAITGEAGIGKSRLIEEQLRWVGTQDAIAAYARSYEAEGDLAYGPVVDWLRTPQLRAVVGRLDHIWQSEVARLVPELRLDHPALGAPGPTIESWQRRRLFDALTQVVLAARGPVLLALDDAQWADQDTLEWLHYLARAAPAPAALLVLGTRNDERQANAPLMGLIAALRRNDRLTEIELAGLGPVETGELAAAVAGSPLDDATRARLHAETDGHPLFIVEVARAGLAQDAMPAPAVLPARMQAFIAARLDQLSPAARDLIEVAAAVGRDFNLELLARASDLEEHDLVRGLDELWQRGLIREDELDAYDIRHDRIREVAYDAMSPIRRRLLHRRIGQALELLHAADLDAVAAHLAGQYEAAGLLHEAIGYYELAGLAAARLSAYREATRHIDKALVLLRRLPPTRERDRREMHILLGLAEPLNASVGFASPQLEAVLSRTGELARALDDTAAEVAALTALGAAAFVAGLFRRSLQLTDAAAALVDRAPEHGPGVAMSSGWPLLALGQVQAANEAFDRALASFDPLRSRPFLFGFDVATFAMASQSHALWLAGRGTEASARSDGAVERADAADDPHLRAMAHAYAAVLDQFRGDPIGMRRHATLARELCSRYEFAYYGEWGEMIAAWADRDDPAAGSAERIEQAVGRLRAQRAQARLPYWLALLAEVHLAGGRPDPARAVLDAALATGEAADDRWWLPEIHRLLGEVRPGAIGHQHRLAALAEARAQGSAALVARAQASLRDHGARTLPERFANAGPRSIGRPTRKERS